MITSDKPNNGDGIDRLAKVLQKYSPPKDLWRRIEGDLREEQHKLALEQASLPFRVAAFFHRQAVVYASFALLLLAGSVASYVLLTTEDDLDFSFFEQRPGSLMMNDIDADIDQAIHHYERAIGKLSVLAQRREAELDPDYVRIQNEKIQLLRTSIEECRIALKQNRDNPQVQHYLLSAYNSLQLSLQEMVSNAGQKKGDNS